MVLKIFQNWKIFSPNFQNQFTWRQITIFPANPSFASLTVKQVKLVGLNGVTLEWQFDLAGKKREKNWPSREKKKKKNWPGRVCEDCAVGIDKLHSCLLSQLAGDCHIFQGHPNKRQFEISRIFNVWLVQFRLHFQTRVNFTKVHFSKIY